MQEFNKLKNYFQDFALIQCKDYGVPQNRPRVLLIGIRKDIKFQPNKTKVASDTNLSIKLAKNILNEKITMLF